MNNNYTDQSVWMRRVGCAFLFAIRETDFQMMWLRLFNISCDIRLLRNTPSISDTHEKHPFIITSLAINALPTCDVCL